MVRITFILAATAIAGVTAFPQFARESRGLDSRALARNIDSILKNVDIKALHRQSRERQLSKRASTWSASQLVDVTGAHAYAPPTASQTRGPCPGLNILSNHGYFDRSGNTNLIESVGALTSVLNMGVDTALALVVYSIAIIGDPVALTWSIGKSPGASTLLPGILSPPGGIDQSHNNYESDASVTRGDSYLYGGDVWTSQLSNFKALFALQPNAATADYNQDVIIQHRNFTLQNSIQKNPRFFFSPFPGLVVSSAAHNNHSAEHPDGLLNQANLKSFFGYTGDSVETLKYNFGTEQIPANWYHAPNPYSLVDVVAGVLKVIEAIPAAGKIGGNTGTVNSFVGVDVADVTGGVLNAQSLLQGNNLICFAFGAARAGLPSVLGGLTSILGTSLNLLDSKLGGILPGLACPEISKWNLSVFSQFPGSG
ncbi:hypothetical protein RQP46_005201 [Phenoliferia psychrophenolica]